mmetsp:Transcript_16345/g.53747  ORF Transcript_16345/g.53747 Transcript_16345/m.53747 type:complete len:212 (+) Transcript_16345:255-890(+)
MPDAAAHDSCDATDTPLWRAVISSRLLTRPAVANRLPLPRRPLPLRRRRARRDAAYHRPPAAPRLAAGKDTEPRDCDRHQPRARAGRIGQVRANREARRLPGDVGGHLARNGGVGALLLAAGRHDDDAPALRCTRVGLRARPDEEHRQRAPLVAARLEPVPPLYRLEVDRPLPRPPLGQPRRARRGGRRDGQADRRQALPERVPGGGGRLA